MRGGSSVISGIGWKSNEGGRGKRRGEIELKENRKVGKCVCGAYFNVSFNIIVRWGVKDQELHSGIFDDGRMVHES